MASSPPLIFSASRRLAARRRIAGLQTAADAARYLIEDMIEDVLDRLSFLRHDPQRALVIGDWTGSVEHALTTAGVLTAAGDPIAGFDEERPFAAGGHDFIASLGTLDTVNDLPGALVHMRNALAPGGLMIASFVGAGSLPALRSAMLAADADRPAPRIHPQIDVRAGAQLLQRAGFADPVADARTLKASFRSLDGLVADLRAQGLSNVLARPGPALGKAALDRARQAFAGDSGRRLETFEIVTLSGWRK